MVPEFAQVERETTVSAIDVYMHIWPVGTRRDGARGEPPLEVELIASHTSDPNHLDPSCPECRRLRAELESMAGTVVQRVASASVSPAMFEIYTDTASIVCPPSDGQRPCVTVSIYVGNGFDDLAPNSVSSAVGDIKVALKDLGVRER